MAQERSITVASTTSTEQSALFGRLLHPLTQSTGIARPALPLLTGQALDVGRRGDADVGVGRAVAGVEVVGGGGLGLQRGEGS